MKPEFRSPNDEFMGRCLAFRDASRW